MNAWRFHLLTMIAAVLPMPSAATTITPSSPTTVIATWPVAGSAAMHSADTGARTQPQNSAAAALLAKRYLAQAERPGQAHFYGLARAQLKPWITPEGSRDPELWLAWAQVQQHQHAFDDALTALSRVLEHQPANINAHLLKARIYLIKDDTAAARAACLALLGHADLLTASACALEVASVQGELASSYQQLSALVERLGLPEDERRPWLLQVLADMALRLHHPTAAAHWLNQQPVASASVNFLSQWADVQLALAQPQNVLNTLQPLVDPAGLIDDSLLLRLALAEHQLGGNLWKNQLQARMAQREQRGDTQHASELARYYLDIQPQPQKALYWAQINWQSAREASDRALLERATLISSHPIKEHTNKQPPTKEQPQ